MRGIDTNGLPEEVLFLETVEFIIKLPHFILNSCFCTGGVTPPLLTFSNPSFIRGPDILMDLQLYSYLKSVLQDPLNKVFG